ncbi:MAG: PadR family transcriptional regulator [Clostridia bacterium]|jgi:PadR family transcriptional regulator, regulatory protein PadR|nr:PadR family transcriptional regulator [Clostridia bacterium]MBT7122782.1 PadR family transcriptional regulator [Clostridia bacterium]
MNTQFKKGVLNLCVLTLLKKKDAYGYDLAEKMAQSIEIAEGTLYPLLRKLKLDGLCETYLSERSAGPPRKYYKLTQKGIDAQRVLRDEWKTFSTNVNELMEENDDE